ncbi:MAG: LacI family DNA-binding transcriptional regulator [Trueperaceae bacterium]
MTRPRPTIHDVAREAGASIATVSRALNGGVVSAAARERIEAAIGRLGYRRNDVARGLVTGRSGLVGVVLPDLIGPLYAHMARGIEDVLDEHGMHAMLVTDHLEPDAERRAIELLRARQVDGLVLIGSRLQPADLRAAAGSVPIAHVQRDSPDDEAPQVRLDDAAGVRAAIGHLAAAGHRRIAHLAGTRRDGVERREAFVAAMAEAGLEPGPIVDGGFTEEGGEAAAAVVLDDPDVTAVFCASDRMAVGLLHAAQRRGITVPDDLSVVGFDDLTWARYLCPPLTTVRQPGREMGRAAARLVLDGPFDAAVPVLRIAPTLVVRASTAAPRPPEPTTPPLRRRAPATEEVIAPDISPPP